MIGQTLSHYQILDELGSGGMGIVYRARDTKLHRDVAIKILPEAASFPERIARFEREAHLLASLNHPNIATIHGLEAADGLQFLVMEVVEGETLAERIAEGALSIDTALSLFQHIAEGLEAAHDKGIIHRDLKPANVKITPEGRVKILDFGLAKVFEDSDPGVDVDPSQSPTVTREGTRAGVILGTAAYMSPEQARGEHVDKRTDIWAFGCCLYEALTGKPPFWGETATDILASVVKTEPEWGRLPSETPFLVRRVLKRCLEKDARRRLHDVTDARLELEDATTAGPETETTVRSKGLSLRVSAVLGVVLFGLGALLSTLIDRPTPGAPVRLEMETANLNPYQRAIAFSRDGRQVAFVDEAPPDGFVGGRIFLRSMDRDVSIPVPGTEGAVMPIFSPDGEWLAFHDFGSGTLKKIPIDGGVAVTLCDLTLGTTFDLDWELEHSIVVSDEGSLYRVPAAGGEPDELLEGGEKTSEFLRYPDVLPGGRAILFTAGLFYGGEYVALYRTDSGTQSVLIENANFARYAPTGHVLFVRDDTLHAVRFDLDSLALAGEPVPVLEELHISVTTGSAYYAFSDSGSLAYVPSHWDGFRRRLVWVDHAGNVEPIRSIPRRIAGPSLAPDGESIVLQIYDGSHSSLWLTEASRETLVPFLPGGVGFGPSWSPDGERIAFAGMSEGMRTVLVKSLRDPSEPEAISRGSNIAWSPDGNVIAYMTYSGDTAYDLWTVALEGDRAPKAYLKTPASEGTPAFSPDGRWLAYVSGESGVPQIYAAPYGRDGPKHQISTDDGWQPLWSPDGTKIYYRSGNRLMAVSIQREPSFRASSPRVLFEGDYLRHDINDWFRNYDLSPDGQRFLMIQSEEEPPHPTKIKIVLNWFDELERLVP